MDRYVNAVLLAKLYTEVARENHCDGLCFLTPEDVTEKILDCAETLEDVKPVVHAHWIKAFFPGSVECDLPILLDVTCSHCAFKMWELYPYCPNCGAKMDEGEDNE